jgi:hypothetical protein
VSRALLGVLVALALLLTLAPGARALPVLAEGDATELAQSLATATKAQGVCYGWNVEVSDSTYGAPTGPDIGSDKGVGVPVDPACPKYVELQGRITFTCESCEAEDSSAIQVVSNMPNAPTAADLEDLGFSGADLIGDTNDVLLTNMVGALPLVTASKGAAAPVPVAAPTAADEPAAGDAPTGAPSTPDWLRENWAVLAFFLVLSVAGLVWLVRMTLSERAERARTPSLTPREQ